MKEFTIGQNDAGQRLDKFLGKAVPLLPSSMMYRGIRTKRIKVNGKRAEISTRLAVGDVVSLYLNDEFFEEKRADEAFLRAGDALSVISSMRMRISLSLISPPGWWYMRMKAAPRIR